ncbi:MAG: MotA/TolQ/ExbB proton channel family protein [Phycisphaeraceae bacterium]
MQLYEQGGWILVAIVSLSVLAWSLIAWKWFQLRAETAWGIRWADDAVACLHRDSEAGRRQAVTLCEQRPNLVGRLLLAALQTHEPQRRFFEKHLQPLFEAEATELRRHLNIITAIAALCPLLGLLGTIVGMVRTFESLVASGVQTEHFASGISQALLTTQAGLVVALPIVLMHGYLASRVDRYVDRTALRVKKVETILCHD